MMFSIRRFFIVFAVLSALVMLLSPHANAAPNVILIMVDDLGALEDTSQADAPNLYKNWNQNFQGYTPFMPNVYQLSQDGMKFRTVYATPLCSSTRMELNTGTYGYTNGWNALLNASYSPMTTSPYYGMAAKQTLAEMFKSKGYSTAVFGKWHMPFDPNAGGIHEAGFDEYLIWLQGYDLPDGVTPTHATYGTSNTASRYWNPGLVETGGKYRPTTANDFGPTLFNNEVVNYINAHASDTKPWFIYYPMALIHTESGGFPTMPVCSGGTTTGDIYSAMQYVDCMVGKVVSAVENNSIADNTLIIFTGDNGTKWTDSFYGVRLKGSTIEPGARVPFVARFDGTIPAGMISRAVMDFSDIYPTLDEASGNPILGTPDAMTDGVSFWGVMTDANQGPVTPPATVPKRFVRAGLRDIRMLRDDKFVFENIDPTGNGDFWYCGNKREMRKCTLVTDPASSYPTDWAAFQSELATYPLPDIAGQELNP